MPALQGKGNFKFEIGNFRLKRQGNGLRRGEGAGPAKTIGTRTARRMLFETQGKPALQGKGNLKFENGILD
jgi:hypothetical protein